MEFVEVISGNETCNINDVKHSMSEYKSFRICDICHERLDKTKVHLIDICPICLNKLEMEYRYLKSQELIGKRISEVYNSHRERTLEKYKNGHKKY